MPAPLSKAPPPPPTAERRAEQLKRKRLIGSVLAGLIVLLISWQVYDYFGSAPQRAEEQVQSGIKLLNPGHYEEAIRVFDEALKTNPDSWNAYLQRGIANQNLGKLDAALADFERALRIEPRLNEALTARAELFRQKGNPTQAVEAFTKTIQQNPNVSAYFSRGLSYAEMGQHEKAIPDFTWVIDQLRDAPFAYLARAKSKRALGDEKGALMDEQAAASFDRGAAK